MKPSSLKNLPWAVMAVGFFFAPPPSAVAHGDVHQRLLALDSQIATTNNAAALYVQRGELHREHRDWLAAAADFDHAVALDSKLMRIDFFRARLFNDLGEPAKARGCLDKLLLVLTNDAEAIVLRARISARQGDATGALADYSRAIELLREPQPEFFLERAELLAASNRITEAVTGLDEGVKRLGPLLALQTRALDLELSRTNHTGALRQLDAIIKNVPRKESWLARQGEILQQSGRVSEAEMSWAEALRAIAVLPERLQESEPMIELRTRVSRSLAALTNAPPVKPAPAR